MSTVNKMIVIGYVGSDPEIRTTGDGTKVANLSVATKKSWQDDQDEWQDKTTWHNVVAWAGRADWTEENIKKGSYIRVEGPIEKKDWTDKEGVERESSSIKALNIQRMGSNSTGGGNEEE
jgi:single-strand DNA-binding protein